MRWISPSLCQPTLTPFLYPPLSLTKRPHILLKCKAWFICSGQLQRQPEKRAYVTRSQPEEADIIGEEVLGVHEDFDPTNTVPEHHQSYTTSSFSDLRRLTLSAGSGGHGCISFLREKYIAQGPPNGGDGGKGGSIYIQAVYGETSLAKLGRQGVVKAGDGRNGRGKSQNGQRGEDIILRVPVGTVVKEIERWDPGYILENEIHHRTDEVEGASKGKYHGGDDKWLHYPQSERTNRASEHFTKAAYPAQHHLASSELLRQTHPLPVYLDLSQPTPSPILLVPGAPGGLGNPHFATNELRGPKFATRGNKGPRMKIELELKILADVGLVGLPNAGKSSFLRAISNKKARVGAWSFTTLTPNIGTVFIDPLRPPGGGDPVESITVADIPGLIAEAHMNKGLGHGFLRHVERAKILAFVIDLNREDPVEDLKGLWAEVRAYEEGFDSPEEYLGGGMMEEMTGNRALNTELMEESEYDSMQEYDNNQEYYEEQQYYESHPGDDEQEYDDTQEELEELAATQGSHEQIKIESAPGEEEIKMVVWSPANFMPRKATSLPEFDSSGATGSKGIPPRPRNNITNKPWFVIANKSDLPGTEQKYLDLQEHLKERAVELGKEEIGIVPISARNALGVQTAVTWMKKLLVTNL